MAISAAPGGGFCTAAAEALAAGCASWYRTFEMSLGGSRDDLARSLASTDLIEALFDRMPDVVFFVKDRRGAYAAVNQTLAERCGFAQKAQLLGKTAYEAFPLALAAGYAEQDRLVLETGERIADKLELHLYRNRRPGWCITNKLPLRAASGAIVGMVGISKDLHEPAGGDAVYAEIAKAIDHLRRHYAEPLRVSDLARMASLSPARFERHVKRIFHITAGQLLTKTRIGAAERLLATSTMPVAQVAHACGFYDHSAFSRVFKATVGVTPSAYRAARASAPSGRG